MKRLLTLVVLVMVAGTGHAKDQRENCNQKAAGASGNDRNQIIAECIRRNASVTTMPPTLARMSQCNREAGEMTGEPRVRFVNLCLARND
jgi:hypothetical protein